MQFTPLDKTLPSLEVFYKLPNTYNQDSISYDIYVNGKKVSENKPSNEDVRKLLKWING
jgi:hypothetical protein